MQVKKNFFEIASDTISNPHNNTYLLSEIPSLQVQYYVFILIDI